MSFTRVSVRWIAGLALLAFVVSWLVTRRPAVDGVASAPERREAPRTTEAEIPAASGSIVTEATSTETGMTVCREQLIDVAMGNSSHRLCMGRTQVVQTGNVRRFRVDEDGGDNRWLRVDAAGETIVAVEMSGDGQGNYSCRWNQCAGVSIGPHDAQGARSIVFNKGRLSRKKLAGDATMDELIVLDGRLRTVPDDQLPATTCVGQLLYISVGAGTIHFCPDGGTGFDVEDDGGTTYRFTNADGSSLGVFMDRGGTLRRVEFGKFACAGPACMGVDIAPADAAGQRTFLFRGTTLVDPGGTSSALLNGNVVLAAQ